MINSINRSAVCVARAGQVCAQEAPARAGIELLPASLAFDYSAASNSASFSFDSGLLPLTGIILCGGLSKRMGRSKSFLPYAGKTLVEHILDRMQSVFAEVILVSNSPDDYEHLSASVVRDIVPNRGPLVGILSGLLVANYDSCFVMPCDMPLINTDLMRAMSSRGRFADIVLYKHAGLAEPLLGVYSRKCIDKLESMLFQNAGDGGKTNIFSSFDNRGLNTASSCEQFKDPSSLSSKTEYFETPAGKSPLPIHFSVDTPADYGKLIGASV